MDNQRLLIWAFFGLMAWITYQTWVQDYAPRPVAAPTEQIDASGQGPESDIGALPDLAAPTDDVIVCSKHQSFSQFAFSRERES